MMKHFLSIAAAGATAVVLVTSAQAATYFYGLGDHPDGNMSATYDYGLRLDREDPDRFFSFGAPVDTIASPTASDFSAFLLYDDVAGTVSMRGTMVESIAGGGTGGTYRLEYDIAGVTNTGPLGSGLFSDFSGTGIGSLSNATESFALNADSRPGGEFFVFGLGSRNFNGITGEGWVGQDQGEAKPNDFLFTAILLGDTPPPGNPLNPVPLPAAGWMLIAGLGGMFAMRRRKTQS